MNAWDKRRQNSGWSSKFVDWFVGDTAHLSVVFSWDMLEAYSFCVWYKSLGFRVKAGGPAVELNPTYLSDVAEVVPGLAYPDAITKHNPDATFTSAPVQVLCCSKSGRAFD
jgi:hypothetical protein